MANTSCGNEVIWLEIEISPVSNWRERDKLKNEIAKPKERKGDPDALVAPDAAKTVAERIAAPD